MQLDKQLAFQDQFGGLPWGLPSDLWPTALLAQLEHHDRRLDLGKARRASLVFQSNNPEACETRDTSDGAKADFILELQHLILGLSLYPSSEVRMEAEARVANCQTRFGSIFPRPLNA